MHDRDTRSRKGAEPASDQAASGQDGGQEAGEQETGGPKVVSFRQALEQQRARGEAGPPPEPDDFDPGPTAA